MWGFESPRPHHPAHASTQRVAPRPLHELMHISYSCDAWHALVRVRPKGTLMAIIDRDATALTADELDQLARLDDAAASDRASAAWTLSGPARLLLASLSASAGAIHLVMV